MSVEDRLGRLLLLVPYVASRDGVPLKELAAHLGVEPSQVESDLDLLSMVGQPPLTPDHLIDLYVEDDIVYVDLDQSLSRPPQLTHEEARSLVLGARLVGDLGGLGKELDGVIERIVAHLNPVDQELLKSLQGRIGLSRDAKASEPAHDLRRAIELRRQVRLAYYSASSDRHKSYLLRPLALLNHSGAEYLVALDVEAELTQKLFRLDRAGAVELTAETFEAPEDFDLESFRRQRLVESGGELQAQVRFAKTVANKVRERFATDQVTADKDGSVRVALSTSSIAWLARWVLPFGTEAEVLSPRQSRAALGRLCREAAAVYRDPPRRS